ncbi:MAG: universal stress protein [Acidimicrobiales bacterium]
MFSTIVVGTDGSETANEAVAVAKYLARRDGAVVHLVHVIKASPSGAPVSQVGSSVAVRGDDAMTREVRDAADAILEEAGAGDGDLNIKTHIVAGSPADALIEMADRVGADLIVVGSKGMKGPHRLIGSVPNSIAHGANCNVLIAKTT